MAKTFRPSTREASIISKIESSKEHARRRAIGNLRDCDEPLANAVAQKLVENGLVETQSKNSLEAQILQCLETMTRADDFDIDYQTAPIRNLVPNPHIISLFLTAFVIEKLLDHNDIVDIYGSDEEIYATINMQVQRYLPA